MVNPDSHSSQLFYRVLYTRGTFSLASIAAGLLGRKISGSLAKKIAGGYVRRHAPIVEVLRRNLELLDKRRATPESAQETFENFAVAMADYLSLGGLPLEDASALCTERHGFAHLQNAREQGRGAILATGHFGFFEYGSLLLTEIGIPVTVLTLGEPSAAFTKWRADFRRRWGAETVEIGSDAFSSIQVVRALQEGRFCALLVDRPQQGGTTLVELPGGEIPFSTSAALLAHLARCPIIPVAVTRRPDGFYRMIAKAPVELDESLGRDDAIREATKNVADALVEEFVAAPTQWFHFVPLRK